jgi:hypothetical protein
MYANIPSCNINSIVLKGWQFFSPTETGNASAAGAGCAKAPATASPSAAATAPSTPSAPTPAQPELRSVRRASGQPHGRPAALQPLRQLRGDPAPPQVASDFWSIFFTSLRLESHTSKHCIYITFRHVTRVHYQKFATIERLSPTFLTLSLIFCIL